MIRTRSLVLAIGLACLTATTALAARPPLRAVLPPDAGLGSASIAAVAPAITAGDGAVSAAVLCFATLRGVDSAAERQLPAVPFAERERANTAAGGASSSLTALRESGAVIPFGTIPASLAATDAAPREAAAAFVWIKAEESANAGPFDWHLGVLDALRLLPSPRELNAGELGQPVDSARIAAVLAASDGTALRAAERGERPSSLWSFGAVVPAPAQAVSLSDRRTCVEIAASESHEWRSLASPRSPAGATPPAQA